MFDLSRYEELLLRHRHGDGSWGELEPQSAHHDPASHDQERQWDDSRLFACKTCGEQVQALIRDPDERVS